MAETKKPYLSPGIESERVDVPEAWACTIYNANGLSGSWSGRGVATPPINVVCP